MAGSSDVKKPDPSLVARPEPPFEHAKDRRPPHPATLPPGSTAQRRGAEEQPQARPPHPATVVQPKVAFREPQARPPHPATVVRTRAGQAKMVGEARPPHVAMVMQRTRFTRDEERLVRGTVQRAEQAELKIIEPENYEAYEKLVVLFQERMNGLGTDEGNDRRDMSEEREKGVSGVRRFVATRGDLVVGWMTLKTQPEDLKIEGICVDPNKDKKKGVAKNLFAKAKSCAQEQNKSAVTLTDISKGTGTKFYKSQGFVPIEEGSLKMRFTLS